MFRFAKNATVIVTMEVIVSINTTYLHIKKIKLTTGFKITVFTCVTLL